MTQYLVTTKETLKFTGEDAADANYAAIDYMRAEKPELTGEALLVETTSVKVMERKIGKSRTVPNKPAWR